MLEVVEPPEHGRALARLSRLVVGVDEVRDLGDPVFEVLSLEREECCLIADLGRDGVEVIPDSTNDRRPLDHAHDVAYGHHAIGLIPIEAGHRVVELVAQPFEGLESLIRLGEQLGHGVQLELDLAGEHDCPKVTLLGHGEDRMPRLTGQALSGTEPGTRLDGLDVRIGHEVHVRGEDPAGLIVDDDATVHLCELRETLRRETGILEPETPCRDGLDLRSGADQHERTRSLRHHELCRIAKRRTWCEPAEEVEGCGGLRSHRSGG